MGGDDDCDCNWTKAGDPEKILEICNAAFDTGNKTLPFFLLKMRMETISTSTRGFERLLPCIVSGLTGLRRSACSGRAQSRSTGGQAV